MLLDLTLSQGTLRQKMSSLDETPAELKREGNTIRYVSPTDACRMHLGYACSK